MPEDWNDDSSVVEWFPEEEVRDTVRALAKQAAKLTGAKQRTSWKKMAALFPPALAKLIADCPWRWGNTVSPGVGRVALGLMSYAIRAPEAELDEILDTIERILPDSPVAALLPEVVGISEFEMVVSGLHEASAKARGSRAKNLGMLLDYVSAS